MEFLAQNCTVESLQFIWMFLGKHPGNDAVADRIDIISTSLGFYQSLCVFPCHEKRHLDFKLEWKLRASDINPPQVCTLDISCCHQHHWQEIWCSSLLGNGQVYTVSFWLKLFDEKDSISIQYSLLISY